MKFSKKERNEKQKQLSLVWWSTPVIPPALGRWRQEDQFKVHLSCASGFKASLSYMRAVSKVRNKQIIKLQDNFCKLTLCNPFNYLSGLEQAIWGWVIDNEYRLMVPEASESKSMVLASAQHLLRTLLTFNKVVENVAWETEWRCYL